jgi:hypothetical protein
MQNENAFVTITSSLRRSRAVPPLLLNELWRLVGQAFSLPDFCHGLLGPFSDEPGAITDFGKE